MNGRLGPVLYQDSPRLLSGARSEAGLAILAQVQGAVRTG